ncbi:hypothetical protein [Streptomyces sp. H27-H5]|uniref:hypothetical protein n=1 Tax=Streptomyces sp. H27-H5 TaxID=2996460 RepID=UPI00226FFB1E|nr:hypothetical protein [Streptomyces sp. H27-H5]MCY0961744.1 hypothetical protein [Streptomyces sp. H27-H5]
MRLSRTLMAGAALIALASLTGCGGDGDAGGGGSTGDLGLPAAGDMASIEKFVNQHAQCNNLRPSDDEGSGLLEKEAADPAWAIKERAVCDDGSHQTITLLAISDMAKFQAANNAGKKYEALVGKNFAVVPEGDTTVQALMNAKMLLLVCKGGYEIPSGYAQHKGSAEGCILTDYARS